MHIAIQYCVVWNYEPRAAGLAAELRREFPEAEVETIPSGGGVFEVSLDGELIFSKKALKRHANPGEVVEIIRARA